MVAGLLLSMNSRLRPRPIRWEKRGLFGLACLVVMGWSGGQEVKGQDQGAQPGLPRGLPTPVTDENFEEIRTRSPFLRSVGLSDSIVLTGVARIEENLYATLLDTETTESHVVSTQANSEGWQLVEIRGNETDLESLTAKVQVAGGEVVSIRYEKLPAISGGGKPGSGSSGGGSSRLSDSQLREAKESARNYREGFSSDGYRDKPPPNIVEKLSRMSTTQREMINRRMIELRNRGMGTDDRRRIYDDMVNRTSQGR